jgi:MerR family mercuric resistance operon transcriptional regulator
MKPSLNCVLKYGVKEFLMGNNIAADKMTIGTLAKAAEVGVETIRYYHRRGLIACPKAQVGYRNYGPTHIERLLFIRRAQAVGFTLDEIAELLRLNDASDHQTARSLAEQKIADVETRIAHLNSMAKALRHLVSTCREGGTEMPCPIIRMVLQPHLVPSPQKQSGRCPNQS